MTPAQGKLFFRVIRQEGYDRTGTHKSASGLILPFGHHTTVRAETVDKWKDRPRFGTVTESGVPFYEAGDTVILSHNLIQHEIGEDRDEFLLDREKDTYWCEPQMTHGRIRGGVATPSNPTSVFLRMGPTPTQKQRRMENGQVITWDAPTGENQEGVVAYDCHVKVHNMGYVHLPKGTVLMVGGGPKPRHHTAECGELAEVISHQIIARKVGDTWVPFDTHIWVELPRQTEVGGVIIPEEIANAYRGRSFASPSRLAMGKVVGAGIMAPCKEGDWVIVNDIHQLSFLGLDVIPACPDHIYGIMRGGAL